MSKNTANIHSYGDLLQGVWTAPIGTNLPSQSSAPVPGVWPTGWSEIGWISDNGVTDSETYNETIKYGWQGGAEVRRLRNQASKVYNFEALEENAVTFGLLRPSSTITTSGAVAEVQTVAFTGTGTAGTWTLTLPGYGTATGLAYNIALAALQTALSSAFGLTMALPTGTPGTTYTITFPAGAGNVPSLSANTTGITGNTGNSVTTGTQGVNGTNSRPIQPYTSRNLRYFGIDLVDGGVYHKIVLTNAEAKRNGDTVYVANDDTIYPMQLVAYLDTNNQWGYEIDNNPAVASGLFT